MLMVLVNNCFWVTTANRNSRVQDLIILPMKFPLNGSGGPKG